MNIEKVESVTGILGTPEILTIAWIEPEPWVIKSIEFKNYTQAPLQGITLYYNNTSISVRDISAEEDFVFEWNPGLFIEGGYKIESKCFSTDYVQVYMHYTINFVRVPIL